MKKNKKALFEDRRKHARLPILHGILEPVELAFYNPGVRRRNNSTQPGILSDLSAGGMRLLTFLEPPHSKELEIVIKLPGLKGIPLKGRISWVRGRGGVFMNGISFTRLSKRNHSRINIMAEDYADCDTRIALKLPEVCAENCRCNYLCNKPQKDEILFNGSHH